MAKCNVCGKKFEMGVNGVTVNGKDTCDEHAGVTRTPEGYWMDADERRQGITWEDGTVTHKPSSA